MSGRARHPGPRLAALAAALCLHVVHVGPAEAQLRCPPAPSPRLAEADTAGRLPNVDAWEAVGATAGVGALFLVDRPVRDFVRRHRSRELDVAATIFRQFGTPEAHGLAGAGVLGVGLVSGDRELRGAGGRMLASFVLSAGVTTVLKRLIGRSRPEAGRGAFAFDPLQGRQVSLPSGHTTLAFALAGSLADEIDRPWASALLYTTAAGTAWSRIYDGHHWPSDVVAGGLVGLTSARFVGGNWTVLGIRSPGWIRRDAAADGASANASASASTSLAPPGRCGIR